MDIEVYSVRLHVIVDYSRSLAGQRGEHASGRFSKAAGQLEHQNRLGGGYVGSSVVHELIGTPVAALEIAELSRCPCVMNGHVGVVFQRVDQNIVVFLAVVGVLEGGRCGHGDVVNPGFLFRDELVADDVHMYSVVGHRIVREIYRHGLVGDDFGAAEMPFRRLRGGGEAIDLPAVQRHVERDTCRMRAAIQVNRRGDGDDRVVLRGDDLHAVAGLGVLAVVGKLPLGGNHEAGSERVGPFQHIVPHIAVLDFQYHLAASGAVIVVAVV